MTPKTHENTMKMFLTKKPATARQIYIKMLSSRVSSIDSLTEEQRGHFLWAELINAGYLNGVVKTNASGIPVGNIISGPTVKGRLFLQKLQDRERKESAGGKLSRWILVVCSFIGGIQYIPTRGGNWGFVSKIG